MWIWNSLCTTEPSPGCLMKTHPQKCPPGCHCRVRSAAFCQVCRAVWCHQQGRLLVHHLQDAKSEPTDRNSSHLPISLYLSTTTIGPSQHDISTKDSDLIFRHHSRYSLQ